MAKIKSNYPVVPLRDIVIFPGMIVPLFVGREKSVRALEAVASINGAVVLVTQKDALEDVPKAKGLYNVGVIGTILQMLKLPDGSMKILIEARDKVKIKKFVDSELFITANVEIITDVMRENVEIEALMRSVIDQFEEYIKLNKKISPEILNSFREVKDPAQLADIICSHITLRITDKQEMLELLDVPKKLELLVAKIENEIGVLNAERKIRTRVKKQMEKTQKDYYLNEQMKAIQKELGEGEEGKSELGELEEKIVKLKLSKEARQKATQELKKLKSMSPMSAEASIIRNYLETLLSLPWGKANKIKADIQAAKDILDKEHYGLDKVKERILEYLAVQQRIKHMQGPIICLIGPPGVGKTSLAKSIADATGRKFVRLSLGGVKDEAEIRGHRKTYIGAMPGKILTSLKKADSSNPVLLLDEIDKLSSDFRGDPAAALLEVLDHEQNNKFVDHYMEVEYDISDVMFIATANTLDMPRPLVDRMEIIRLPGYIESEKIEIAKRHLVEKQKEMHGLLKDEWSISDEAIRDLIRYYTREAGVRSLERELANLHRKAVKEILLKKTKKITISTSNLAKYAGVRKYSFGEAEKEDLVGSTTGLAFTEVGGELLIVEGVMLPGKGNIKTTGKLGEVMQESAQAAFSYFKSKSAEFGIIPPFYQKKDMHVHFPEGATPKDGPSAGVAIFTTVVSAMTGIAVKKTVAMTGEITLRGRVLPIGGLKEKLIAALRGGIKTVLIPKENIKDLAEIPKNIKKGLEIIPVATAEEALLHALVSLPKPVIWNDMEHWDDHCPEAEQLSKPSTGKADKWFSS